MSTDLKTLAWARFTENGNIRIWSEVPLAYSDYPSLEPLVLRSEAQAAVDAARAETERVLEDAERYRWLRHGDNDERVLRHYSTSRKNPQATMYLPRGGDLDGSIDKLRAALNPGEHQ